MPTKTYRQIADEALGPAVARRLWTANYLPAWPATFSAFSLGAVLPAVMYLARWGHRRGRGKFAATFGPDSKRVSADDIAASLIEQGVVAADGDAGRAVLADLLLAHCFDTRRHEAGRDVPVLRAYPVHYFSSWVDLPETVADLRNVPEMITAILAGPQKGEVLRPDGHRSYFSVGMGFENNLLLKTLGPAVRVHEHASGLTADQFVEEEAGALSVEQLLMVGVARLLGQAPEKSHDGNPGIPSQLPLAETRAAVFRDDVRIFTEVYADLLPWAAFVSTLETALAIGLTAMYLGTAKLLLGWRETGRVPDDDEPWPLFADFSAGNDRELRTLSEESLGEAYRVMHHLPVVMATLRVLDDYCSKSPRLRDNVPPGAPYGRDRMNFLGAVYREELPGATAVLDAIDGACYELRTVLEEEDPDHELLAFLDDRQIHPADRLGEALVRLMGATSQEGQYVRFLSSCLFGDENNPYALLRRRTARDPAGGRRTERRSFVPTNQALEFLVHRYLWKNGRRKRPMFSLEDFLGILRDNYGWYVDQAPPGMTVATDALGRNRRLLERRLRDLGLLVGVNDAESMKLLRGRYGENLKQRDAVGSGKDGTNG